jgi:hypothetical protein
MFFDQPHKEELLKGFKGKALVGFVDILGFRNEILTKWDDKYENPLERLLKLKSYAKRTSADIKHHTFFDNDENIILEIPYAKVLTFSDSFIFILPIEKDDPEYKLGCILSITGSIIELWRKCIEEGFTIRGAVDHGEIFFTDEDLIGPSLIKAYENESNMAITSRIIYTSDAIKIISENLPKSDSILNQYFKRFLVDDVDSHIILNPVIIYGYEEHLSNNIKRAIDQLIKMKDKTSNYNLKAKYYNLIARLKAKKDPNNNFEIYSRY